MWYSKAQERENRRMQTDLSHLPEAKQRELEAIAGILRAQGAVEMVILFGSYARGDYREAADLAPEARSGHPSDYDFLVVVEKPTQASAKFCRQLRQAANATRFSADVRPIVHDITDLNQQLAEGRSFFLDIKREGRLLYDSGEYQLAEPRLLTALEQQRIAQADFDHWFDRATSFFRFYEVGYAEGDLRGAVFNLNQAAESAYKAILLVFTRYLPHEHLLAWLGEKAAEYGPVFEAIFPQTTEQEQERFSLLDRAYIGARYHKDFVVFWGDVEYLAPRVKRLLEETERLCRTEIDTLTDRAQAQR